MPFLHREHALLEARQAWSWMVCVTVWFLDDCGVWTVESNSLGEGAIWEFCLSQNSRMNRSLSANVLSRWEFCLSQIFTDEQRPICKCLKPLGVLSLTELTDEQKPICERLRAWYVLSLTELTDEQKPICECLKPLGVLSLTELTDEQKPICERLREWYVLSLTDFHRWTEAFLLTGETHKRLQADDREHRIYSHILRINSYLMISIRLDKCGG